MIDTACTLDPEGKTGKHKVKGSEDFTQMNDEDLDQALNERFAVFRIVCTNAEDQNELLAGPPISTKDLWHAARIQGKAGSLRPDNLKEIQAYADELYEQRKHRPTRNNSECYAEILANEFISNRNSIKGRFCDAPSSD
eukprot:CAMPEP_0168341198 /NCGR_PEP_ID=MMETSP0213-20121227/14523_1 /TAXON_ID=151035 /ORGANISM="Euplotes harpa, Strain FSP1.4" /LENGTH=138 /DNA_ID=CAMNT_0008347593 /DNA_START=53 /DNA_END=469 /DNA_ORIENTATION=-